MAKLSAHMAGEKPEILPPTIIVLPRPDEQGVNWMIEAGESPGRDHILTAANVARMHFNVG